MEERAVKDGLPTPAENLKRKLDKSRSTAAAKAPLIDTVDTRNREGYIDFMRVYSYRCRLFLACTLVVLFFALSFNAYACLLPVNSVTPPTMDPGCSTPDGQPVSQLCDAFTTLGVQSADTRHLDSNSQTIYSEDTASLAFLIIHTSSSSCLSDHPTVAPPQDLLLKISVLRI